MPRVTYFMGWRLSKHAAMWHIKWWWNIRRARNQHWLPQLPTAAGSLFWHCSFQYPCLSWFRLCGCFQQLKLLAAPMFSSPVERIQGHQCCWHIGSESWSFWWNSQYHSWLYRCCRAYMHCSWNASHIVHRPQRRRRSHSCQGQRKFQPACNWCVTSRNLCSYTGAIASAFLHRKLSFPSWTHSFSWEANQNHHEQVAFMMGLIWKESPCQPWEAICSLSTIFHHRLWLIWEHRTSYQSVQG